MSSRVAASASRSRVLRAREDVTVYPVEEKVGEDFLQRLIVELLRPMVERWLAEQGVVALTGADQFVYFRRGDTRKRVAPDVFVLPGVRPGRRVRSWKTWEEGIVPSFALEVVSLDVDKDYIDAPTLYRELGVKELVVFDPDYEAEPGRYRFQVFRLSKSRGVVREVTNEDRVRSKTLGCWIRATGVGETTRLRLATGPHGDALVPTDAEEREHERTEKEAERAAKEHERAEKERERAAKEHERAEKERERAAKEAERAEKERERARRIALEEELARLKARTTSASRGRKR
ncbi:MAG: Uma2 family endonuclease [Polyangiaceae bacterium]